MPSTSAVTFQKHVQSTLGVDFTSRRYQKVHALDFAWPFTGIPCCEPHIRNPNKNSASSRANSRLALHSAHYTSASTASTATCAGVIGPCKARASIAPTYRLQRRTPGRSLDSPPASPQAPNLAGFRGLATITCAPFHKRPALLDAPLSLFLTQKRQLLGKATGRVRSSHCLCASVHSPVLGGNTKASLL